MHQIFFIILALLQLVMFFVLLFGKSFLRITEKGRTAYSFGVWDKVLVAASVLSIGVIAGLFVISGNSSNQVQIETSTDSSENHVSKRDSLLARYGYKADTGEESLGELLKDSLQLNALILKETGPEIGLDNSNGMVLDSIKNATSYFSLSVTNRMAPASHILLKTIFAAMKADGDIVPALPADSNFYIVPMGTSLGAFESMQVKAAIPSDSASLVYCLLTGYCTNTKGNATYSIRRIYCYDASSKQCKEVTDAHFKLLDNFFRRRGL